MAPVRGWSVPRGWPGKLAAIAVLGLVVRVAWVLAYRHIPPGGDAYYYHFQANLLVDGHGLVNPLQFLELHETVRAAEHPPLYTGWLALFSLLGMRSFLSHRLASCLLGMGTVVVAGLLGRDLGRLAHRGDRSAARAGLAAAAVVALYPALVLVDTVGQADGVSATTALLAVWCCYRLFRRPSFRNAGLLGLAIGLASLARTEKILLLLPALAVVLLARKLRRPERVRAAAAVVIGMTVLVGPWVARNLTSFNRPVLLGTGLELSVDTANCDSTFDPHSGLFAFADFHCPSLPPAAGDQSDDAEYYRHEVLNYLKDHKRRLPEVAAARVGRTWNLYSPVGQTSLDRFDGRPVWASRIALLAFYPITAAGIAGVLALRRRRVPVLPLLSLPAIVTLQALLNPPYTRYRAPADAALCVAAGCLLAWGFERRGDGRAHSRRRAGHTVPAVAAAPPLRTGMADG